LWHVPQVRPLVPKTWKKSLPDEKSIAVEEVVDDCPVASGVVSVLAAFSAATSVPSPAPI